MALASTSRVTVMCRVFSKHLIDDLLRFLINVWFKVQTYLFVYFGRGLSTLLCLSIDSPVKREISKVIPNRLELIKFKKGLVEHCLQVGAALL